MNYHIIFFILFLFIHFLIFLCILFSGNADAQQYFQITGYLSNANLLCIFVFSAYLLGHIVHAIIKKLKYSTICASCVAIALWWILSEFSDFLATGIQPDYFRDLFVFHFFIIAASAMLLVVDRVYQNRR